MKGLNEILIVDVDLGIHCVITSKMSLEGPEANLATDVKNLIHELVESESYHKSSTVKETEDDAIKPDAQGPYAYAL